MLIAARVGGKTTNNIKKINTAFGLFLGRNSYVFVYKYTFAWLLNYSTTFLLISSASLSTFFQIKV